MEDFYDWFILQSPPLQALIAGMFTWGMTALGSGLVFFFNSSNRKVLDCALGFTGGDDSRKFLVFIISCNRVCRITK